MVAIGEVTLVPVRDGLGVAVEVTVAEAGPKVGLSEGFGVGLTIGAEVGVLLASGIGLGEPAIEACGTSPI